MNFRMGRNVRRRVEDAHRQVTPEQALSLEVLEILTSFYFLKDVRLESEERLENMRTLWFTWLLHDDIVLRLCKFDEDDSRSWSFTQALKKLRKRSGHRFVEAEVEGLIKEFRDLVRPIRAHRDSYIAHRSKRDRAHLKPPEYLPAIRLAVRITDMLAEERVSYEMLGIDLREDILN